MEDRLKVEDLKNMFIFVAEHVIEHEEFLTAIDQRIGDGDHGINMALGFKEVRRKLELEAHENVNEVFQCVGMTLLDTMGGASGVLFGTVFISGIVGLEPQKDIDLSTFARIFQSSSAALKKRGKAKVGDKTMIDAFEPATLALLSAADIGLSFTEALTLAAEKAREGMEKTKQYVARFGRAKSYGEAAIGHADAGAVSVSLIFQAMARWMRDNIR